jgi:hypothetical protein
MKSFFGFGLIWAAYLLAYYGWSQTAHTGAGILDLALPSRMPALVSILGSGGAPPLSPSQLSQIPVTPNLPSGQPNIGAGFTQAPILAGP